MNTNGSARVWLFVRFVVRFVKLVRFSPEREVLHCSVFNRLLHFEKKTQTKQQKKPDKYADSKFLLK